MFQFSTRRLGGANVFMMLMRQCSGRRKGFEGLAGPTRAAKLSKTYSRLTPKRFEVLKARAKRVGPIYPRPTSERQKPNRTARFVRDRYHKVEGEPAERFRLLAKEWSQRAQA
jgi:hypothetical protein